MGSSHLLILQVILHLVIITGAAETDKEVQEILELEAKNISDNFIPTKSTNLGTTDYNTSGNHSEKKKGKQYFPPYMPGGGFGLDHFNWFLPHPFWFGHQQQYYNPHPQYYPHHHHYYNPYHNPYHQWMPYQPPPQQYLFYPPQYPFYPPQQPFYPPQPQQPVYPQQPQQPTGPPICTTCPTCGKRRGKTADGKSCRLPLDKKDKIKDY